MFRLKGIPKTLVLTLYLILGVGVEAQQPFDVDTTFRCGFNDWYVNSILTFDNGQVLASGQIKVPGELVHRTGVRLDQDGTIDPTYPIVAFMGGKLTPWQDRIYTKSGASVRRIHTDGTLDASFNMIGTPYFGAQQGGDYHVFPDGRILMSGAHNLHDSVRGFVGIYDLIWFTNTGRLDTTRIHRRASGAIYEIAPMDNGQFLCYGTGDIYEGQPVGGIFRVNADGSLDTTLYCQLRWGEAYSILPLPDGRFYAAGIYSFSNGPLNIIRLARFLPNGDLDPTFDNAIDFDLGEIPDPGFGATVARVRPWENGSILVMGTYQFVNGEPRRGICVIDSTGQLTDLFDGCGVGPYTYQGFTYGSVAGYLEDDNGMAYIWGAYHGYNDGTTNDTLQRFVTRLYGPDFTTSVREPEVLEKQFSVYPNPAAEMVTFNYNFKTEPEMAFVIVRDAMGREVSTIAMPNKQGQLVLDTRQLTKGMYAVSYTNAGATLHVDRLIVR
ncbi:MAG: T9SS type A sorting domain-containing protein [Flavobacteriales bacterium]|nr:T9SS type A sorting domain-containing protein [Flavobacteriales bacterium]